MNYTIQQLNYLIALDIHRNFSKAAEHAYVSQPTLSMQVKKLEHDLGVLLIDRSKQPLMFTELGREVVDQARKALDELNRIDDLIADSKGEIKGELVVGIIPTLAPFLIPMFLGSFLKNFPEVELTIVEHKTDDIISLLKQEKLDVGILATPLNENGIQESPLFYEKLLLYASEEMSQSLKNRVTVDRILMDKLWVLSEGNCFRNQTFNLCSLEQTDHRNLEVNYESGSIETLIRLVDREGGSTIIPELSIDLMSEARIDRVHFIGEANPVREISTVTRRSGLKAGLIGALRQEILENLPKSVQENETDRTVISI